MWTTKGITDELFRGEMKCICPRAKDADVWILIWEESTQSSSRRHLGGSRACKKRIGQRGISLFEKFFTERNEKADELATAGIMMDGGEMSQIRATTAQKEREEVYAALQYAASVYCLVEEWKDCEEFSPKLEGNGTL